LPPKQRLIVAMQVMTDDSSAPIAAFFCLLALFLPEHTG
jgi:hypothetical protein